MFGLQITVEMVFAIAVLAALIAGCALGMSIWIVYEIRNSDLGRASRSWERNHR